ncbi:hypothetical protein EMPS_06073 [Entomortierella parvispora]|uniref:START domain-containing protein n=1 Tax=Entomortierella parvispora TaxID=205924 RepID=A0A9P3HBY4_9FUNG|nr:hypothetical protein EMPS_06073 [Entomortierella parvispora]
MKESHRSELILGDENLEWTEQHHRNTAHKGMYNLSQGHLSSGFDLAPSGDESDSAERQRRSQFYTPDPRKSTKEYHIEQATQAIHLLKAASKPTGWKKVLKHKSGCLVYQSTNSSDKHPAFKGEHVLRGYRAQDVFSVVGVRKLWDDWYDELSCVESYDDATNLMYMVMKGTLSSKTRDISMVERIEVERDGTIYFASCSVESSKIPRISGKVRADIFVAGWIIQPLPSNPPITKITYVIQTDLLSRLPKFIARRALAKRPLVITTIETHLKKNGVPMVMSNLVSQTTNRHRSLSEPLKPDKFSFSSREAEEPLQSGSAFLSPIGPILPDGMEQLDEKDDLGDDDFQLAMASVTEGSTARNSQTSLAPSLMSTRSIFTPEFLEKNARLGDTALFGDSLLFGKGGLYEGTLRRQDGQQSTDSRASAQQEIQTPLRQQERSRPIPPQAAKTLPSEPEPRSRQSTYKNSQVQPAPTKTDSKPRQPSRVAQPSTPERTAIPPAVTLATPPLTPTTSIDGKDTASDSDASLTPKVKVVPRVPKVHAAVDTSLASRPSSMAFAAFGMQSPSAIMEARRHSSLIGRSSSFAPRHSHIIPLRGNSNLTLQGLGRASLTIAPSNIAAKRNSTAPSLDSSRSSTLLSSSVPLPHRHSETARKALAMFKVLASSPEDRWRAVSTEGTFKCYSRIISGAGLPMLRGEGVITGGWTVEQINAVIESSGCRQIWDERFENLSIAETFNSNEYLFHVTLRGIGSLTGRDLAGVTIIDRDPQTSALCNVSTSVLDPTIPEDPGRIRAMLELSGWSLRPTFDNHGNTVSVSVTFVIQIDIRGTLPTSVVKSMTSSMMTAVSRLNQFINKTGYPPYASHISGTRLLDTFEPKTGFYELCYKAAPGWTEVRVGRKVYKDGYDFFIKPDDPTVRVELAPDFGGVRVWTTLDHEGQSIVAQVTRKGQNPAGSEARQNEQQGTREDDTDRDEPPKRDTPRRTRDNTRVSDGSVAAYGGPSLRKSPSHLKSNDHSKEQASMDPKDSPESERSRSRSRVPRSLVSLPTGAPPPPLPRRSSSLSRYSIPILPYLSPSDAPPLPILPVLPQVPRLQSECSQEPSLTTESPTLETASLPESTTPLGSPTLGPFHVPHPVAPVAPIESVPSELSLLSESPKASSAATTDLQLTQQPVLAASILQPAADIPSCKPSSDSPANVSVSNLIASMAVIRDMEAAIKQEQQELQAKEDEEKEKKKEAQLKEEQDSFASITVPSLAEMSSPMTSPLPSRYRKSGLSLETMEQVLSAMPSPPKRTSSLPAVPRRVTFSPDVIDNSDKPPMSKKPKKQSKKSNAAAAAAVKAANEADSAADAAMAASEVDSPVEESTASVQETDIPEPIPAIIEGSSTASSEETVEEEGYDSDEGEFVEALAEVAEESSNDIEKKEEPKLPEIIVTPVVLAKEAWMGLEIDHEQDHAAVWGGAVELFMADLKGTLLQAAVVLLVLVWIRHGLVEGLSVL